MGPFETEHLPKRGNLPRFFHGQTNPSLCIFNNEIKMFQKAKESNRTETLMIVDENEIILQSLSEGVCRISTEGFITYSNESAERLLGRKGLIDRFYGEAFFLKDKASFGTDAAFCPIQFVLDTGETSHVSNEIFLSTNKNQIQVEYVCVPIIEGGEVFGAVISFQGISERLEAEKAIAEARDFALEAAKTKAMFLANMSHEIRTPLNGVIGTTNLLSDTNLSKEQSRYVKMLRTSTDLLHGVVEDILNFSKFEAGKFVLEKIDFDIAKLVREAVSFFSVVAESKGLKLECAIDPNIPLEIHGDANKIRQILINLIGNAVKFTEKGAVLVKVSQWESEKSDIILKFEISDTGIGIAFEKQKQLFQPFTQADASTTRLYGGTGLGLAISKGLVEMMSGEIGVESKENSGSKFWFTAKFENDLNTASTQLGEKNLSNETIDQAKEAFPTEDIVDVPKISILIAEDNQINRDVASETLDQIGFASKSVGNGIEAINEIEGKDYDLVFMDCQMPGMDGYEATQNIRKFEKIKQPIIIALTADVTESAKKICLEAGMDGHLAKPITKKDFLETIFRYFDHRDDKSNLDLDTDFVQHSVKSIVDLIEPQRLKNFSQIEASGKKGFTREILGLFVENAKGGLEEIDNSLRKKNAVLIAHKSHTLKGSCANVGLTDLFERFEKLELILKEESWKDIETCISEIKKEFDNTCYIIANI